MAGFRLWEQVSIEDLLLPRGTRHTLVPALKHALASHQLKLLALDLFDEFIRVHMPLVASAKVVESCLETSLRELPEAGVARMIPGNAEEQLRRYLKQS
jgi:hypothetical protein